ncbi:arrestin domain-containing protein 3-like isoform X1 [Takifugu rubripes]|uniref:Arrestin domain-containing protein 3-like n=1 Tax=Takifugu rubripes TaxID=31033 RepID=A0A674NH48_TAKRU|nr:arrestin domain-containing protein 3-like isoform X1 [Takifugu rubripes]|eukprot:XP_011614153.1 PREDICTED: arrestin domain-containing protein 3-like isoform X1 [Takifugu rubripes]
MFQQAITNFNINYDVYNESRTFFSGDRVTGNISFELKKEIKISTIGMEFRGMAHVHWSSSSGGKKRRSRHYSAKLDYFRIKSSILQDCGAADGGLRLQRGTHVYPFTLQIPQGDFPSTFRGVHGIITYTLTVTIYRPWHLSKSFVTELMFMNRLNLNQPELWSPLSGTNSTTLCCLWCASGPITLTATTEKKVFAPGETVKIVCELGNSSSRTATPKGKLLQKQNFFMHNKVNKRLISQTMASMAGHPVSPHTSEVHTELMLTIPPSAPYSIANCSILEVQYVLEVSLGVSASPDVTVMFPIILCNTSAHNPPALSL